MNKQSAKGMLISLICLAAMTPSKAGEIAASKFPTARQKVEAKFAAVNRHDITAIVQSYGDDAVLNASDFCATRSGRADVERTYRAIFAAVPDIEANIVETVEQGDRVAVRVVLKSSRPGQEFELPLMNFFTVRDGLIVRDDGIFDNRGRACKA